MTSILRKIIQAVSPKAPGSAEDLLSAVQREVWPLLQQLRRRVNDIVDVIDTYPTAFDDHTALTAASRATARQHPSAAINTDDSTFIGRLLGTNTLKQAMVILDALVLPAAFPGFYPGPMKKVGTDDPGNSGLVADGNHSHPAADPAVEGSYLYPAKKSDQLARTEARCLLPWGAATGTLFSSLWTQISGVSTWQWSGFAGQLYGMDSTGSPGIVLEDGDVVVSWCPVTIDPPWTDPVHFFTYEVVDCGFHMVGEWGVSTKPVIRRMPDANTSAGLCNGAYVYIGGTGVQYEGKYLRITTDNPIVVDATALTLELLDTMTAATSYELLTSAQLVTEPADSDNGDLTCYQSFGGEMDFPQAFMTLAGTPGTTSIPAGTQSFAIEQVTVTTGATSGTVTLRLYVYVYEADGATPVSTAFVAESSPLFLNTTTYNLTFQYELTPSCQLTSAQRILLKPVLYTDITELVTVTIRYNSSTRGTWWKSTMSFDTITTAEEDWFDVTIDGDGILDTHGHTNLKVRGGTLNELNGITTAGHRNGHTIACTFLDTIVMNDGADVASPVFKLWLEQAQMGSVKTGGAVFRMIDIPPSEEDPEGQIQCWRYNGGSLQ
jgi:hypothetical protein